MKQSNKQEKATQEQRIQNPTVRTMIDDLYSATDPNGSYTGKPKDKNEVPVQDADDL